MITTQETFSRAKHSGVQFRIATADDDAGLRRLLRENPMAGDIQLSLEREPNYFAASAIEGPECRTIVAIDENRVVCAGSISARLRYVNGKPMHVGYLGGLRLDRRCRNRISIIRRGYDLFRKLHESGGPPIYLTSIVADNAPARRLLERGLPGMPTYRFLGEFTTLVIRSSGQSFLPSRSAPRIREVTTVSGSLPRYSGGGLGWGQSAKRDCSAPGTPSPALPRSTEGGNSGPDIDNVLEGLNSHLAQFKFAPVWTRDDFQMLQRGAGLDPSDLRMICSDDGDRAASALLWDQRKVRQTVVRGYSASLKRWRPLINVAAKVLRTPTLPAIGEPVSHAFVSHLCSEIAHPEMTVHLFRKLAAEAHARGIDYLTAGFDSRDPRLAALVKAFRPRKYLSRLYAVHWDYEGARLADQLDDRLLAPEVALL